MMSRDIDAANVSTVVWHEIKTRELTELTEEEREYYSYDISYVFVCEMPSDGDEILIATKWGTDTDICCDDDYGLGLEKRGDWKDVLAWAYLPKYIAGGG